MNSTVSQATGLTGWQSIVNRSMHVPSVSRASLLSRTGRNAIAPAQNAPQIPNLWVENGAIWSLPNFLIGFTDYFGVSRFTSSVRSEGYTTPAFFYAGTPFSVQDVPILASPLPPSVGRGPASPVQNSLELTDCPFLVWVQAGTVQFVSTLFCMLSLPPGKSVCATGAASPVVPFKLLQNFPANSPSGTKRFTAKYILYSPKKVTVSGVAGHMNGVQLEMQMCSWKVR